MLLLTGCTCFSRGLCRCWLLVCRDSSLWSDRDFYLYTFAHLESPGLSRTHKVAVKQKGPRRHFFPPNVTVFTHSPSPTYQSLSDLQTSL